MVCTKHIKGTAAKRQTDKAHQWSIEWLCCCLGMFEMVSSSLLCQAFCCHVCFIVCYLASVLFCDRSLTLNNHFSQHLCLDSNWRFINYIILTALINIGLLTPTFSLWFLCFIISILFCWIYVQSLVWLFKKQLIGARREHSLLATLTNLSFQRDLIRRGRLFLSPSLSKPSLGSVPTPVHRPTRPLPLHWSLCGPSPQRPPSSPT